MKIVFEERSSNSCGCPVYDEPYHGFFKEQGINSPAHFGLCEYENRSGVLVHTTIPDVDVDKLDYLLPVFPAFSKTWDLYINNGEYELSGDNWRMNLNKDPKKRILLVSLGEVEKRAKKGEDSIAILKPTIDKLVGYNVPHWLGYNVQVQTSAYDLSIVLREDFNTARQRIDKLFDHVRHSTEQVYSKLSDGAVRNFIDSLEGIWERYMLGVQQAFNAVELFGVQLRQQGRISESGNVSPQDQKQLEKLYNEPQELWLKQYEAELAKAGLVGAEQELADGIRNYCSLNGFIVKELLVEGSYRLHLLTKGLEAVMR